MKHPFIILGSLGSLLIVGVGVWVFFFLFYTPAPAEPARGTNPFVETGADESGFREETREVADTVVGAEVSVSSALRHITTRRVVGAVALENNVFRFVEAGTGHVYEVTDAGSEVKLAKTTFPQAREAVWSSSGTRVAITRETSTGNETFLGALTKDDSGEGVLEGVLLEGSPTNIAFGGAGETLYYTISTPTGLTGTARNLKTNTEQTLFSTPLKEVIVSWEPKVLIVTKASGELTGFAYGTDMSRKAESMNALMAKSGGDSVVFSGRSGSTLTSWVERGKDTIALSRGVIPSKCAFRGDALMCALPKNLDVSTYPDAWYRGEVSYDDSLWLFNAMTGEGEEISRLEDSTGKVIDVAMIKEDDSGYLIITKDGGLMHYASAL